MFNKYLLVLTSFGLLDIAHAQYYNLSYFNITSLPPPDFENTALNITFSDPRTTDCGRSSAEQNESATLMIRISASNDPVCFDLDDIFTHPSESFANSESGDPPRTTSDGALYSVSGPGGDKNVGWSPDTLNYSQIFYMQRRASLNNGQDDSLLGRYSIRAFSEEGCPYDAYNNSAGTWYTWNCASENGVCSALPFSVKSIRLYGLDRDQRAGEKGCVNAQKNAGTQLKCSLGFVVLSLVVAMIYLL